ncbi:MAG: GTPase [Pirellulaceae bacterium]|nr:GTPase [Pirellulaceae bacterium]
MVTRWRKWRAEVPASSAQYEKQIDKLREKAPIPSIWLFGKTGSGKSSIIRYLTGAESATIGEGYRPETKTSRRFDFPDPMDPLLAFIDTRGLGEATYDPTEDIERFNSSSQLMIIVVRVADHALQSVISPLRSIRKASPNRPMLLVLTCLHEVAGTVDLSSGEDPFLEMSDSPASNAASAVPMQLRKLMDEKAKQFKGLYDLMIPVDLTQPFDGFADPDFGGQRLKRAILEYLPHAYRQALLTLNEVDSRASFRQTRSRWQVLTSSAMAATAGAVPIPWLDIPVVLALQTHLAVRIASIYERDITTGDWAILSSAAGSRIALRMALFEMLKFIPVWGMAVGAASSFAFTYALGMSWDWYFSNMREGNAPSAARLKEVFSDQLKRGHALWRAE